MKKLIAMLRRCVHPFSVSQVLANFEQKLEQLRHVHAQRTTVAAANVEVITRLSSQNSDHYAEAQKAIDVEAKLRALLTP